MSPLLSLALKLVERGFETRFNPWSVIMQRQLSATAEDRRSDGEADEVEGGRGRQSYIWGMFICDVWLITQT